MQCHGSVRANAGWKRVVGAPHVWFRNHDNGILPLLPFHGVYYGFCRCHLTGTDDGTISGFVSAKHTEFCQCSSGPTLLSSIDPGTVLLFQRWVASVLHVDNSQCKPRPYDVRRGVTKRCTHSQGFSQGLRWRSYQIACSRQIKCNSIRAAVV